MSGAAGGDTNDARMETVSKIKRESVALRAARGAGPPISMTGAVCI